MQEALVEEVFTRFAPILELTIGGRVIRTTAEHPFWAQGQGWVSAGLLKPGDLLAGFDGEWTPVESVVETGQDEIVYNMRVGGSHTYFVGDEGWGFAVWAHNAAYDDIAENLGKISRQGIQNPKSPRMNLMKTELHHLATNKGAGSRWPEVFETIFRGANMTLDDGINLIRIQGHAGPHGLYNHAVFQRLFGAIRTQTPGTAAYRRALRVELALLRGEVRHGTGLGSLLRERADITQIMADRQLSFEAARLLGL